MESEFEAQLRSERALGMRLAAEIAGLHAFAREAAGSQDQAVSAACINNGILEAAWKLEDRPMRADATGLWPPHQRIIDDRGAYKTPGRWIIRVRHYLFGWLASDRTYLVRSDNGFRVGVPPKKLLKQSK